MFGTNHHDSNLNATVTEEQEGQKKIVNVIADNNNSFTAKESIGPQVNSTGAQLTETVLPLKNPTEPNVVVSGYNAPHGSPCQFNSSVAATSPASRKLNLHV